MTVNKYNNIHHSAIKIKPIDVKSSKYIDFFEKKRKKKKKKSERLRNNMKFEVGDHVRISK